MAAAEEKDHAAAVAWVDSVAADCWKRCCGEVWSVICREAVKVGVRAAAGVAAAVLVVAASEAVAVVALGVVSEAETVSVEAARVAHGRPPATTTH